MLSRRSQIARTRAKPAFLRKRKKVYQNVASYHTRSINYVPVHWVKTCCRRLTLRYDQSSSRIIMGTGITRNAERCQFTWWNDANEKCIPMCRTLLVKNPGIHMLTAGYCTQFIISRWTLMRVTWTFWIHWFSALCRERASETIWKDIEVFYFKTYQVFCGPLSREASMEQLDHKFRLQGIKAISFVFSFLKRRREWHQLHNCDESLALPLTYNLRTDDHQQCTMQSPKA